MIADLKEAGESCSPMKRCLPLTLVSLACLPGISLGSTPLVDGSNYPGLFGAPGDVSVTTPIPSGAILGIYLGGSNSGPLGSHWSVQANGGAVSGSNLISEIRLSDTGAQVALTGSALEFNVDNPPGSLLGSLGVGLAVNLSWSATATFNSPGEALTLQPNSVYRVKFDVDGGSGLLNSTLGIAPTFGVELLDGSGASISYSGGGTLANVLGLELLEIVGAPAGSGTATAQFQTGSSVPAGAAGVRFTGSAALPATALGIGTNFATVSNLEVIYVDPYTLWIEDTDLTEPDDQLTDADPDGDGRTNLEEFAVATDPEVSDVTPVYVATGDADGAGPETSVLVMTIPVRTGAEFGEDDGDQVASQDGAGYRVEGSFQLLDWALAISEVAPNTTFAGTLPPLAAGWEYRSFRVPGQTSDTPRAFLRLIVNE